MNLGSVIRRVQRIFGDDHEVQVKATDIIDWVNEAISTMARESEFASEYASVSYTPTTQGFSLPTGFFREKRVTFNDSPLLRTDVTQLDSVGGARDTATGTPSHFYMWHSKLWIYPTPASSGTMKFWYVVIPGDISDPDTELPVPAPFHVDVVRFCLARARELDEDYTSAQQLYGEVTANMGRGRDEQQNRSNNTFPVVRDDPADAWY